MNVVSVNLAVVRASSGAKPTTGIDKRPTLARVGVHPLGLDGDTIVDLDNHGGLHQAVYAYAQEDAGWWANHLSRTVEPGHFGENLTTVGIPVTDAVIGEQWRVGSTVLQVTRPRIPCTVFAAFWDVPQLVTEFTRVARPGAYFSVVRPGELGAGDSIEVVHRPGHGVTIGVVFRALTLESELLPLLLTAPELPDSLQSRVRHRLGLPVPA